MATDLHLHGINVDNAMDGVAPVTQDLVEPAVVHLRVHRRRTGRGHVPRPSPRAAAGAQRDAGHDLRRRHAAPGGPDDRRGRHPRRLTVAEELPLVLNDSGVIGYSLNGKSFPATAPIAATRATGSSSTTSTREARSTRCTSTSSTSWWWRRTASRWTTRTGSTRSTSPPASGTRCWSTPTCRDLGLALPHPRPRRARHRDVRDGHRRGRELTRSCR